MEVKETGSTEVVPPRTVVGAAVVGGPWVVAVVVHVSGTEAAVVYHVGRVHGVQELVADPGSAFIHLHGPESDLVAEKKRIDCWLY